MSGAFSSKRGTSFAQKASTNCAALLGVGCELAPEAPSRPGSGRTTKGGLIAKKIPISNTPAAAIAARIRVLFRPEATACDRGSLVTKDVIAELRVEGRRAAFVS